MARAASKAIAAIWRFLTAPFRWFADLVAAPKFFRRSVLLWAMGLVTWVVYRTFEDKILTTIQAPGASVVLGFIGVLATIVGLYQYLRSVDERQGHS